MRGFEQVLAAALLLALPSSFSLDNGVGRTPAMGVSYTIHGAAFLPRFPCRLDFALCTSTTQFPSLTFCSNAVEQLEQVK